MQVWITAGIAAAACAFTVIIGLFAWRLVARKRKKLREERMLGVYVRHELRKRDFFYTTPEQLDIRDYEKNNDCSLFASTGDETRHRNTIAQLENVIALENGDDTGGAQTEESGWTSAGDDAGMDVLPSYREVPQLEFSLVFASTTNCLNIHVIRVVNLPAKYIRECSSYTKVTLTYGSKKSFRSTQIFKNSLNPEYDECFSFVGYNLQDIQHSSLRFSVYVKANLLKRYRKIGNVIFHMTQAHLMPDEPMIYLERLTFYGNSRKFGQRKIASRDLGFVFLSLQYQPCAERLKVLIRKAENLPKEIGVSIVASEYYVIIHLMKGIEEVNRKETNSAMGPNPIWNQAFLFDLKPEEHGHYWLQFVVMKGKKYQRHWPLGKFLIGARTTATGIAHWNEAMEPRSQETARWHCIL